MLREYVAKNYSRNNKILIFKRRMLRTKINTLIIIFFYNNYIVNKVIYFLHVHTINIIFINFIMSPDTKHYETLILSLNTYYWSKRQP